MNELISKIEAIVNEAECMKNSYFFSSPANASGRRYYEVKHSHEEITWTDGNNVFTAEYTVSCSCRNVYARGIYTKNGNKTTLTAIKNSLKRLQNA